MGYTNYQSYKIRALAYVYINGTAIPLDITSGSFTYALNSIPQGSVQVALGRNTVTGIASTLYTILEQLTVLVPIEVWMEVRTGPNSIGIQFESWPTGYFKVFSGLITSTGDSLSRTQAGFTINMTGWLCDLNFSSALSRSTQTLTPQMLSNAATFSTSTGVAWSAENAAIEFATPLNVGTDFWGLTLGPWLQSLCTQDILTDPDDPATAFPGSNFEASAALKRFEPFIYGKYRFGQPLAIPLLGLPGVESIAGAIAEDVAVETYESIGSTTIWDKLVGGYAPSYRFGVVPLVDTALVVPFTPGMRFPWQTIWGQEYTAISVEDQKPRPIKGIRMFTGSSSLTGVAGTRLGEADEEPSTGGRYDNPNFPGGMIIYMNAPRWTANAVSPGAFGADATAPFGIRGGAVFPGVGVGPLGPPPAVVKAAATNVWDAYAQAVYVAEALRGRTGSLQGKLRFDVAPGSTVVVQTVRDKFVKQQVGQGNNAFLYAEVMTVSFSFDAEAMSAGTTFALMNVRNGFEDTVDATSVAKHPLYANAWNGAPLVENEVFLPQNSQTTAVFSALP